ncbi:hypothetical protein Tco_1044545 [Tanacetum coccineum]|uniref:Uncharacterized protein n=1 Tax=Tanacetum coccineum TaxID=301880 RepID=A0ABQ5GRC9_9ASTR
MRMEALQALEDLMESIQNFLEKFNRIYFRETLKILMQAWDKFFEVKHAQSKEVQELLNKLLQDLQSINEELAEYINTPSWNLPTSSYDDDDDEYSFATQEYLMTCSTAITPDSPKMDSLIMSEDECECDMPDCDDSQTTNFSTFSNPLFDDSTSSDDESSHEEVIHEMSFKTYSNPLFDLDEEIISSEFNPIHNEDLDSTPKNDRFDTESYLLESLLNRDTLMASSPKIDSLLDEFAGELITIPPRIVNREHEEYISLMERLLYDNSSPRPPLLRDWFMITHLLQKSLCGNKFNRSFPLLLLSPRDSDTLMLMILFPSQKDHQTLDHLNDQSSPRPPPEPPDDGIYFEPDTRILTIKVVGNIFEHHVLTPRLLPPNPPCFNEDKSPLFHYLIGALKLSQLYS